MARVTFVPEDLGSEVLAPSGYYQPIKEEMLDYYGKRLLYVLGAACIEASCCGRSSWSYVRVEGYLDENDLSSGAGGEGTLEIDTIEAEGEKAALRKLLQEKHPGARIEFR